MSIRVALKTYPSAYEELKLVKSFTDSENLFAILCEGQDAKEALAMMGRVAVSARMRELVYFFGDEAKFVLFNHPNGL